MRSVGQAFYVKPHDTRRAPMLDTAVISGKVGRPVSCMPVYRKFA